MARCPSCDGIVPQGSNCLVDDTDCITHSGSGEGGDGFVLDPVLSVNVNQLLTCADDDGILALPPTSLTNPPTVQAYRTSPQSIPNNTLTAITFNVERWDNDTMHSVAANTNRITFTTAGKYMVSFVGTWKPQAGSTGTETIRIVTMRKNGTDVIARDSRTAVNDGFGVFLGQTLMAEEEFNAADYVEILVLQNIGAALAYESDSFSPVFTAYREAS